MDEFKRQKIAHVAEQEPMKIIELVEVIEDKKGADLVPATEALIDAMEQDTTVITDTSGPSSSDQNLDQLQLKYDQLKANFDQLSQENVALKETAVKLEAQQQASSTIPTPQLSKAQLYKGIRKYLGPSMAALVRMEMFGGGERAWKEDEREFAMELLQLGDDVYTHCLDEWRFRLPSLRLTNSWLQNTRSAENEDEDL